MAWETVDGRRPELEALDVNYPEYYHCLRLFPKFRVATKSGRIFYAPAGVKPTAQVNRNQQTGAITGSYLASAHKDWAVDTVEARVMITREEVENFGGVDFADEQGARGAKKSAMEQQEIAAVNAVFAGTPLTFAAGEFIATVRDAAKALKPYSGRLALVLSLNAYGYLMDLTEIRSRLTFDGTQVMSREQLTSLTPEVFRSMLQGVFAVEDILIGDDDFYPANKVAVVKLPAEDDLFSFKRRAELGRMICYSSDGVDVVEIESACDRENKRNIYDANSYFKVVEFNPARKVIQLYAESGSESESGSASAPAPASGSESGSAA